MKLILTLLLILISPVTFPQAISDTPQFTTPIQQQQYSQLTRIIRCPTCQNQDIAESNAPLAKQLRHLIAEQIQAGKTNKDITDYLIARYGDFITYDPRIKKSTLILWYAPAGIMLFTLISWLLIRRFARPNTTPLTDTQKAELAEWLKHYRN